MSKMERIKSMLKDQPNDAFLLFALAKEYEYLNNWNEAINGYQNLLEHHPFYTGAFYHLANALLQEDRIEEAKECYEKGIAICRQQGDLHALSELQNAYTNFEMENL